MAPPECRFGPQSSWRWPWCIVFLLISFFLMFALVCNSTQRSGAQLKHNPSQRKTHVDSIGYKGKRRQLCVHSELLHVARTSGFFSPTSRCLPPAHRPNTVARNKRIATSLPKHEERCRDLCTGSYPEKDRNTTLLVLGFTCSSHKTTEAVHFCTRFWIRAYPMLSTLVVFRMTPRGHSDRMGFTCI